MQTRNKKKRKASMSQLDKLLLSREVEIEEMQTLNPFEEELPEAKDLVVEGSPFKTGWQIKAASVGGTRYLIPLPPRVPSSFPVPMYAQGLVTSTAAHQRLEMELARRLKVDLEIPLCLIDRLGPKSPLELLATVAAAVDKTARPKRRRTSHTAGRHNSRRG